MFTYRKLNDDFILDKLLFSRIKSSDKSTDRILAHNNGNAAGPLSTTTTY